MMNSRRICPADGSQYKDSAVGLVFMESAVGLAMETSKVESASLFKKLRRVARWSWNEEVQQEAIGNQQMKRSERDEATSCWKISRWISVDDVIDDVIIFSRWFERAVARISSRKNQSQAFDLTSWTTRRKQQHPVESLYEPAVAMNTVASFAYPVASFAYPVASSTHSVASFGIQTQEKKK
ncbi:hypothetical protein F511_41469 [Dorcoceras hygrometricum]|uniref:Uncharacterized protein n=1 Tax=Dorcoceras hygrometricum TaxID=472368 RepID=A0A2Z7AC22_9LAMI|nr:hypothetical protein F511_41469 [Dorcoceras hygrometricum]